MYISVTAVYYSRSIEETESSEKKFLINSLNNKNVIMNIFPCMYIRRSCLIHQVARIEYLSPLSWTYQAKPE